MICRAKHRCKWVSEPALRIRVTFSANCSYIRFVSCLSMGASEGDFAANASPAVDEKNVCGLNFWIQFNVILPAAPDVTRIVQQIVHVIFIAFHLPEFLNRHMDK